jgi:hypothetical protein
VNRQAYGIQRKNISSSMGRPNIEIPVMYLSLKPQTPHLVNRISQIINSIPGAAMAIPQLLQLAKNLTRGSKLAASGMERLARFNNR